MRSVRNGVVPIDTYHQCGQMTGQVWQEVKLGVCPWFLILHVKPSGTGGSRHVSDSATLQFIMISYCATVGLWVTLTAKCKATKRLDNRSAMAETTPEAPDVAPEPSEFQNRVCGELAIATIPLYAYMHSFPSRRS